MDPLTLVETLGGITKKNNKNKNNSFNNQN